MQNLLDLRNKVIEKEFGSMNDRQFEAVTTTEGPLLVLAGAGSGKTTVLVNRIACLCKYGNAYGSWDEPFLNVNHIEEIRQYLEGKRDSIDIPELASHPARPWEILAITFTNKAAGELKERIALKLGDSAGEVAAGTFHSICGKILRRNADKIGFTSHFTIYDTDDQKKQMKEIMKAEEIDESFLPIKVVLKEISSAKDRLITPEEYISSAGIDYKKQKIGLLYKKYQARLMNNDAMDFDDMIYKTVELFAQNPDVLGYYQNRYKYIMVDEYQDTNHAQYVLVRELAAGHRNICVVGDDDQSIYRFRGASIENILSFEDEYSDARVIRLEQNYRSTQNILDAANAVIKNNKGRKAKALWTDKGAGNKITVYTAADERSEARYVADQIIDNVRAGAKFSDHAVLYRMNAQSNALENVFSRSSVAYRVIGGMRFFERKEIKDILAYLTVINNPYDDLRLKRIINEPKRGIGDTTVANAQKISDSLGISLFEVFSTAADYPLIARAAGKLSEFCTIINELRAAVNEVPLGELLELVASKTGYIHALELQGPEEQDRIDNIRELGSSIAQYVEEAEEPSLSGFLEEIALFSDIDAMDNEADRVVLMTIHSAKGLEFKNVFLIGMEDGIFPGQQSIYGGPEDIEEERRLAYVAITRAKENLSITKTTSRLLYGSTTRNQPSRFLNEVPKELCEVSAEYPSYSGGGQNFGGFNEFGGSIGGSRGGANKFSPRASLQRSEPKKASSVHYSAGMAVEHRAFGEGIILSVQKVADDYMLEINFSSAGVKKVMANYAKLKII